jgi:hypothetical protein
MTPIQEALHTAEDTNIVGRRLSLSRYLLVIRAGILI